MLKPNTHNELTANGDHDWQLQVAKHIMASIMFMEMTWRFFGLTLVVMMQFIRLTVGYNVKPTNISLFWSLNGNSA